jgi:hypothetical protein
LTYERLAVLENGRSRGKVENTDYAAFAAQVIRAHGRRVAGGDVERHRLPSAARAHGRSLAFPLSVTGPLARRHNLACRNAACTCGVHGQAGLCSTLPINVAPVVLPPGRCASRTHRVYRLSHSDAEQSSAGEFRRR